jgi:hypothetical protein
VIGARGLPGLLLICNIFWERSNAAYTAANVVIRTVREARLRRPFSSNCAAMRFASSAGSQVVQPSKWPALGHGWVEREQSQPA